MRAGSSNLNRVSKDIRQLLVSGILFGVFGYGLISCSDDKIVDDGMRGTPVVIEVPGFPPIPIPDDNPLTKEGIALGRKVFYDPILSGDNTLACSGCHNQKFAFSDNGLSFSVGIEGIEGGRNAPPIINLAWIKGLFWDGRAPTLEAQAESPVPNPIEMHLEWTEALDRLNTHPDYPALFEEAFGSGPITRDRVVRAIAQFERTLISADSNFDRFRRNSYQFTAAEKRGFNLFFSEKGSCFNCHGEPFFSDHLFHNNGIDAKITDPGLIRVTQDPNDLGKFRSPTLRNIEFTGPYMHDGRFETLEEVLDHYNSGGFPTDTVDSLIAVGIGLGLTDQQKSDIISFLKSLSDPGFLANPAFSNPFE